MSILLDDDQQAIATESRRVADARMKPEAALKLLEARGEYDAAYWDMAKDQGWTALTVPEAYGGIGLGLVELGQVALAIGATLAGAPFVTSGYGVADAIARHGDDVLKSAWLERLASGDAIGAVAVGEGSSALPRSPSVTFTDGRLTGTKLAVSGASHADVALVLASDNGAPVLVVAAQAFAAAHSFCHARVVALPGAQAHEVRENLRANFR